MRRRYVYDKAGNAIEVTDGRVTVHHIIGEIDPYRSTVDGSVIDSRTKHREHLKRHGMREIDPSEVSNDRLRSYKGLPDVAPQQRKEIIRAQIDAIPHDDFKKMLKRDIDNARWNSRND